MGFFKRVFKAATTVFRAVKAFNFLGSINPFVALGVFAVGWLFVRSRKPDVPDFGTNDFEETERGILVNKQSNNASIPVVYGERLLGGTRVFIQTSGTDNEFLYIALVLCEGEINSIEEIRVDDKVVTFSGALTDNTQRTVASSDSNFYKDGVSYITVEPHLGTDSQSASSLLSTLSNWGTNHKLSGIAYLALRFKWNQDIFGGIPTVQAKVKGRKVVTLDSSLSESSETFSTNPAFCLLDYLRNERYGKGIATANIDLQSFRDASQVCITQVTPFSGGSDINIFDTNAVLDTSKKVIDNVRDILRGCRGYLPYVQGKYKLIIETTGTASVSLDEDDIIGGYSLSSPTKNSKYNRVIATFINPDRNFQADQVTFPPTDDSGLPSSDRHANLKSADGGFLLESKFDFSTITSPYQAEEMAEIILRRSRESLGLSIVVGFNAYQLHIGDIVNITLSSLGFSTKAFRVIQMTFNDDYTITLQLVEHQDSHYTFASKTQVSSTPSTTLPNPFVVQPPASVTLSDTLVEYNDGTVIVALDVAIGASPDSFVDFYQVEYKLSTDSNFIIGSRGSSLNHRILNVIDQKIYDVRVKAVNTQNVSSSFVTAQRTIIGAIESPSDVTDFSCNIIGQEAHLSWKSISDLDLAFYQIRFSNLTSNAEWANSVDLVQKLSRPGTSVVVPARVGSYLIKAVDKLGNLSVNETIVSSNVAGVLNFNPIITNDQHPNFDGTTFFDSATGDFDDATGDFDDGFSTNLAVADSKLRLNSSILFDSGTGNFDDSNKLFDSSPQNQSLPSEGFYNFGTPIDLGSSATSRVTATIKQSSDNVDDVFDSRSGDFDDQSSSFDGDTPINVRSFLQISTSDDNITYTEFRDFVIGEYKSRFFKFRLSLQSLDQSSTPLIEELSISIDMVDRIFSENNITSGTSTKSVSFTNPFYSASYALGITAENMTTGDFFEISNKTVNGFDIIFKNSSGSAVSRNFDFLAKGH